MSRVDEQTLWVAARNLTLSDAAWLLIVHLFETDDLDQLLCQDTGGAQ